MCVDIWAGVKAGIHNCYILCFVAIETSLMTLLVISSRLFSPDDFFLIFNLKIVTSNPKAGSFNSIIMAMVTEK